jgi:hypothetical protein
VGSFDGLRAFVVDAPHRFETVEDAEDLVVWLQRSIVDPTVRLDVTIRIKTCFQVNRSPPMSQCLVTVMIVEQRISFSEVNGCNHIQDRIRCRKKRLRVSQLKCRLIYPIVLPDRGGEERRKTRFFLKIPIYLLSFLLLLELEMMRI